MGRAHILHRSPRSIQTAGRLPGSQRARVTLLTLGVTTSTRRGGAAILDGATLLAKHVYEAADGHAERLFGAIDACLADANVTRRAIGLVACDVGPGSFTGVRVGVAAMQGVARALAIPAIGVLSLEAMAHAAHAEGHAAVLALLDAKKAEVFFALFGSEGREPPAHVRVDEAARLVELERRHGAVSIGEIGSSLSGLRLVRHPSFDLPDPAHVALAALSRLDRPTTLEPVYVRAPDAKPSLVGP